MTYYVAVYLRDDSVWKRHSHGFSSFSRAQDAMDGFIRRARDSLEGKDKKGNIFLKNKVRVFSKYQWDMLAIGYKHPEDRPSGVKVKAPTPFRNRHSQLAEQLRDALRAVG